MTVVSVHGAEGRMGQLVTELVTGADDLDLAALITEPGGDQPVGAFHPKLPLTGQEHLADVHPAGGVIIDFSLATALAGLLEQGRSAKAGLVVGTTGYSAKQIAELEAYAQSYPVVLAANFSFGIPALHMILKMLARTLPTEFMAEEVETHHRHKLDKPSGTAKWLEQAWHEQRGGDPVPIHSQRLGGVIGEHAWTISDDEETLEITHRAHSRRAFLRGVLPAVRFVAESQSGLYGLPDVLAELGER